MAEEPLLLRRKGDRGKEWQWGTKEMKDYRIVWETEREKSRERKRKTHIAIITIVSAIRYLYKCTKSCLCYFSNIHTSTIVQIIG